MAQIRQDSASNLYTEMCKYLDEKHVPEMRTAPVYRGAGIVTFFNIKVVDLGDHYE